MVKKVIKSCGRKLNVLRIKSKHRFLLRKKKNLLEQKFTKKQSKIKLNEKEVELIKKTLQPLIQPRVIKPQTKKAVEKGSVVILLAGPHKGKHGIVLKVLKSGLLLVTGPHKINGLPLRRVNSLFTIVTSTKLDLNEVKIDERINDDYFKKSSLVTLPSTEKNEENKKKRKIQYQQKEKMLAEGNLFKNNKKEKYELSQQRKQDQLTIDKQILQVIKNHKEKEYLVPYLASEFYLKNRQYPHKMRF